MKKSNDTLNFISNIWQHYDYWNGVIEYCKEYHPISSKANGNMKRDNLKVKTMALVLQDRFDMRLP